MQQHHSAPASDLPTLCQGAGRDARILELARSGLSLSAVAAETGLTKGVIAGVVYRHGLRTGEHVMRREAEPAAARPKPALRAISAVRAPDAEKRGGKRLATRRPAKAKPVQPIAAEPTAPSRFACLVDALVALDGGCRWPMEDADGVWFCGGLQNRARDRNGEVRTSAYCAEHHTASIGKGTPTERRATQLSSLPA